MAVEPPLELARVNWIQQLHEWLGIVCDLSRIQSSRYDEGLLQNRDDHARKTYRDMLTKLPDGTLKRAYTAIEAKLAEVTKYVQIWLQYQSLWDMEASSIYNKLGDDLRKWQLVCC